MKQYNYDTVNLAINTSPFVMDKAIYDYVKNKKNTRVLQIIPNYVYFQQDKEGYLLKNEVMLIIFEEITELDC